MKNDLETLRSLAANLTEEFKRVSEDYTLGNAIEIFQYKNCNLIFWQWVLWNCARFQTKSFKCFYVRAGDLYWQERLPYELRGAYKKSQPLLQFIRCECFILHQNPKLLCSTLWRLWLSTEELILPIHFRTLIIQMWVARIAVRVSASFVIWSL